MAKDVWLVFPDQLSTRMLFDAGVVARLSERLGPRLALIFLLERDEAREWAARAPGVRVIDPEAAERPSGLAERAARRIDRMLDRHLGYFPLAIRLNYRHGFHLERMAPGHANWMLDSARAGRLPRWQPIERAMQRWHFSARRHVPRTLLEQMRRECGALVLTNVQPQAAVPYLLAARRLGIPVVAHVASWDHTVGKGVIPPFCDRYLVQNRAMEHDLARYHNIVPNRVVVTGWPQTDVYFRRRPREDYDALLGSYGLDPARPLVVMMGNTPTNAPYEGQFVARLVGWWEEAVRDRFSLLLRPHPRDREWRERFAPALGRSGVHVQDASFTDFEALATLLQHCDCVVANAGTILLDALVNDRPAVCVLYDEGAPPGESWAVKNVLGEHYRELTRSDAFYRAESFDDVVQGIERALANPAELAEERCRVSLEVVGDADGRAAERVVDAILAVVA
ncbi:MAG: CDP-glycerol glycerophosphotransferase family protein [Actinobacteria bacterium]|nr:CDP-glycerol glycerophosphotransferase family protein [Actinomycetota bacterium]